jgi:diaminopimelate epimerase
MKIEVVIADPAGNRTAIVRSGLPRADRAAAAAKLMEDKSLGIEQVGFETRPLYGGSAGRIEMAGGEFCGNAARSYGYLLCSERGTDHCKIEISGTREQLEVICDPERSTSAAQMPMPEKLEMVGDDPSQMYPLVVFRGIAHMLCRHVAPDEAFADRMIRKFGERYSAFGIQFLEEEEAEAVQTDGTGKTAKITPVVYVAGADTCFWEKACASGALAMAWFETQNKKDGFHAYTYAQPGGGLTVKIAKRQGRYAGTVGGILTLEAPFEITI